MLKILYIDVFCEFGHINLNKTYINRLRELGIIVDLAIKKGYINELDLPKELLKLAVPNKYFRETTSKIRSRIDLFNRLTFIRRNINLKDYDFIFFSSYEEISLYFSRFNRPFILVNHSNVDGIENFIKRFFIKAISKNSKHIVFTKSISDYLVKNGIEKVLIEPLGLSYPYKKSLRFEEILYSISDKMNSKDFSKVMFCPTGVKYSSNFTLKLINDVKFIDFLERENILLVVKDKDFISKNNNILIIKQHLSEVQYQSIFIASSFILLPYPPSFRLRVSAVFYECLSNKKTCLLSDIQSFKEFSGLFNYNPYFNNIDELINSMSAILKLSESFEPYRNLDSQIPNFTSLFNS